MDEEEGTPSSPCGTRNHPSCRDGLVVRQTPHAGRGLFTTLAIGSGDVVGFYTGEAHLACDFDRFPDAEARNAYAVTLSPVPHVLSDLVASSHAVVCPCRGVSERHAPSTIVDTDRHPMSAANEPPKGERANLAMRQLNIVVSQCDPNVVRLIGRQDDARRVVRCCALIACRPIAEEEELTWHYGRGYASLRVLQGYRAGLAGRLPALCSSSDPYEIILRWGRPLPTDAVDRIGGGRFPPPPTLANRTALSSRPLSPPPESSRHQGDAREGVYELLLTCNRCGRSAGLFDRVMRSVPAAWIVTDATPDALPRWIVRYGFRFIAHTSIDQSTDQWSVEVASASAPESAEPLRTVEDVFAVAGVGGEHLSSEAKARLMGAVCEVAMSEDAGSAMRALCALPSASYYELRALDLCQVRSLSDAAYMGRTDRLGVRHGAVLALDLRGTSFSPADAESDARPIESVRVLRGRMQVRLQGVARPVTFSNRRVASACGPSFRTFGSRLCGAPNYRTQMVRTLQTMRRSWLLIERCSRGGGFSFIGTH